MPVFPLPPDFHAALIHASREPIYFCTPDYVIQEANDLYAAIEGLRREEVIGRTVPEVIGAEIFARRKPFLDGALAGRRAETTAWVRHPVRGLRHFQVSYEPVIDADGKILGAVAFGHDTTELRAAEEALRLSESIIAQVSDRISVVGLDYRYRLTNESNARFNGLKPDDIVGLHVEEVIGRKRFLERAKAHLDRCFAGEVVEYVYTDTRADGSAFEIDFRLEPFRLPDGTIDGAVMTARDVTETRRMAAQLAKLANEDALTGIGNRRAFEGWIGERLHVVKQGQALDRPFAIVFIDLDGFKAVNDTAGHAAGDQLLCDIARTLRELAAENVLVARIGGDEFGLVIDSADAGEVRALCQAVLDRLDGMPFRWEHYRFRVGASIGLALVSEAVATDLSPTPAEILQWADNACMRAKDSGGHRMAEFVVDQATVANRQMEHNELLAIERALADDAFLIYRMPICDAASLHPVMHEVMLRLPLPNGELRGQSMIVSTAERHGLMGDIDAWVLKRVLDTLAGNSNELPLSVNLSADFLSEPELVRTVLDRLKAEPVLATRLVIELSESTVGAVGPEAWAMLGEARGVGCRLALDGFGVGFPSVANFQHDAFDFIKIDRTLIDGVASRTVKKAVVTGVIGLATTLGLPTIAEFVEDLPALDALREIGVTYVQGAYCGRPVPWIPGPLEA